MKKNFRLEILEQNLVDDPNNMYEAHSTIVYRECSTDTLFISINGQCVNMYDPETGLPLTYKVWQQKYQTKK